MLRNATASPSGVARIQASVWQRGRLAVERLHLAEIGDVLGAFPFSGSMRPSISTAEAEAASAGSRPAASHAPGGQQVFGPSSWFGCRPGRSLFRCKLGLPGIAKSLESARTRRLNLGVVARCIARSVRHDRKILCHASIVRRSWIIRCVRSAR